MTDTLVHTQEADAVRIPMSRLVHVELRKLFDTRAGAWLVGVTFVLSALLVIAVVATGSEEHINFANLFAVLNIPTTVLLPILAILLVTSEWSQHTAMVTFALEPDRRRIFSAKFATCGVLLVGALVNALVFAVIGNLFAQLRTGAGSWSISASVFRNALLIQSAHLLQAFGFATLIMNSAFTLVAFFALPAVWTTLTSTVGWLHVHLQPWVDVLAALEPLNDGDAPLRSAHAVTSAEWSHLAVAMALWVLLPLMLGYRRFLRTEIK